MCGVRCDARTRGLNLHLALQLHLALHLALLLAKGPLASFEYSPVKLLGQCAVDSSGVNR